MKYAHFIGMRVFASEDEDETEILKAIQRLFPFDPEDIKVTRKTVYGFDKKIIILKVSLKKQRRTSKFLKYLMSNMDAEDKETLRQQIDSRLDDRLHFYIRLDKESLLDGRYKLTDSGSCFHIRITVASYPHKWEKAKEVVLDILEL